MILDSEAESACALDKIIDWFCKKTRVTQKAKPAIVLPLQRHNMYNYKCNFSGGRCYRLSYID